MKNVYILTEEGRDYSKEGCQFIESMIREKCNESDELIYSMGKIYNDAIYLKEQLEKNKDVYIAISMVEGIMIIYGENIDATIQLLKDFPNQSCWESISKEINHA